MNDKASEMIELDSAGKNYRHYSYNRYYGDDNLSKRYSYAYDDQDDISRLDRYGYGDHGGSLSGYGHHGPKNCCPLVVKPLVLVSLLGGLAIGTIVVNIAVTMMLGMMRRKRRSWDDGSGLVSLEHIEDLIVEGRKWC